MALKLGEGGEIVGGARPECSVSRDSRGRERDRGGGEGEMKGQDSGVITL